MIQSNSVEYAHEPETEVHIFSVKSFSHKISFIGSTDEGIDDEEQHVGWSHCHIIAWTKVKLDTYRQILLNPLTPTISKVPVT